MPDTSTERKPVGPPRDGLFRGLRSGVEWTEEVRADNGAKGILFGHFAVFNRWTEIDSIFEGRFMERIVPGAFKKTFAEQRDSMRVLFQHGRDTGVGDKPLGPIDTLREDDTGAFYEVPLLREDDGQFVDYIRGLVPGLKAGLYGASFRFRVMKETFERDPEKSDENPEGIPERTIQEAQVFEFGPVTFPAYPEATAGVRSLTDQFMTDVLLRDTERFEQLIEYVRELRLGTDAGSRNGGDADPEAREGGKDADDETNAVKPGLGPTPPVGLFGLPQQKEEAWRLP